MEEAVLIITVRNKLNAALHPAYTQRSSSIQTHDKYADPTRNASLIPQVIFCSFRRHPLQVKPASVSSRSHQFTSPSPSHSDYFPLTPPSQAPANAPPPAPQQPQAQADCSSAPASSPIHAEIPQHRLQQHPHQLLSQHPHPQAAVQVTLILAVTARDRKGKRLRGTAGCSGLLVP
jgi:hypothetical protein